MTVHIDLKAKPLRSTWIQPRVSRIAAGTAENGAGMMPDDAVNKS